MLNIECLFMKIAVREQALVLNALSLTPEFGSALLGFFPEQHHTPWDVKSTPLEQSRLGALSHHAPPLGREGQRGKGSLYFLQKRTKILYIPYIKFTLYIQEAVTEER